MQKVLVVEDTPDILEEILATLKYEGFEGVGAENGSVGVTMAREHLPDLVVCDIMMPELDGYGVLQSMRENPATASIPFIFLTAKADKTDVRHGMGLGADDYLTKPFTSEELVNAVRARLNRKAGIVGSYEDKIHTLSALVGQQKQSLETELAKLNTHIRGNVFELVQVVSKVASINDRFYHTSHEKMVAIIARALAESLSIEAEGIGDLVVAALLHDIGKIGMPDRLLKLEPEQMGEEDFHDYRAHVEDSLKILDSVSDLDKVRQIISQHHENFDGSGFPSSLSGKEICTEAQVLSIANLYHTKVHKIHYASRSTAPSEAYASQTVKEQVRRHGTAMLFLRYRSSWFCPEVLKAFFELARSGRCPAVVCSAD